VKSIKFVKSGKVFPALVTVTSFVGREELFDHDTMIVRRFVHACYRLLRSSTKAVCLLECMISSGLDFQIHQRRAT
jgi:hypothetical protein